MKVYKIYLDKYESELIPNMSGGGFRFEFEIGSYEIIELEGEADVYKEIPQRIFASSLNDYGISYNNESKIAYITQPVYDNGLGDIRMRLLGSGELYDKFKGFIKAEKIKAYIDKL